jgi:hypothetical protein
MRLARSSSVMVVFLAGMSWFSDHCPFISRCPFCMSISDPARRLAAWSFRHCKYKSVPGVYPFCLQYQESGSIPHPANSNSAVIATSFFMKSPHALAPACAGTADNAHARQRASRISYERSCIQGSARQRGLRASQRNAHQPRLSRLRPVTELYHGIKIWENRIKALLCQDLIPGWGCSHA